MSGIEDQQELRSLARRIAQSISFEEQARFRVWVAKLVEIRGSDVSALVKAKQVVGATVNDGVAVFIARLLTNELRRLGWNERGLKWRVGVSAAIATAVLTGGQGAGIAAMGGAIGVPLWLVLGAGGAFLAMLYEELVAGRPPAASPATSAPADPESGVTARVPRTDHDAFVIDVLAKEVVPEPKSLLAASVSEPQKRGLWVGELNGAQLVFDPDIQLADGPHVFLWNSSNGQMERFVPALVRKEIRTYRGPRPQEELHRRYAAWLDGEGEAWLAAEAPYYRERLARELAGASGRQQSSRATHCYECKSQLAGSEEFTCPECGWLTCWSCRACGCGYR